MADPYISEIDYRGSASTDHIEIVVDAGTDVSNIQVVVYHPSGDVRSVNALGSPTDTQFDSDIYVIAGQGVHMNGAVALVVDGTVTQFVSFEREVTADEGPADGLTSTQIGSVGNDQAASLVSTDGGATYTFQAVSDPGVIPCFLSGTPIATPMGSVVVQDLKAGDLVETPDGPRVVRWIGRSAVKADTEAVLPVHIPKNSLGPSEPETDLWVSQNHRIAISGSDCELLFGSDQVLVAAKFLVGQNGIALDRTCVRPVYYHLLFDTHELVWSSGLLTESFHPGDMVTEASSTFEELQTLFPELVAQLAPRRTHSPCLRSYEAQVLLQARAAWA